MADINVTLDGPEEFEDMLNIFADQFPEAVASALWEELSTVMNESKILCPVEFGTLRASGYVTDPVIMADDTILASIGYSADYAAAVHERLGPFHRPPTQAKFLEQPITYRAKWMIEFIVKRVNRILGGPSA